MGYTPIPRVAPLPTRLERLRRAYIIGRIDAEEFEERVATLLASGLEDDRTPDPPPKPTDAGRAIPPSKPYAPPLNPSNRS